MNYKTFFSLLAFRMTARALTTRHLVLRARVGATAVRFVCLTLTRCVLALGLVSHSGSPFARYSSPKLLAAVMFGVRRLDPPFAEDSVSSIKLTQFSSQRVVDAQRARVVFVIGIAEWCRQQGM